MDFALHKAEIFEKMKRVLIISYFFPPLGGIGVQRVLKFVKYLPHFGWQPSVLTLKNPDYEMFDPELLKDVPIQTKIIRTRTIEPSKIYHSVVSLIDKIRSTLQTRRSKGEIDFDVTPKHRLDTKISNFIFIPDNRVGWLSFAFLAIRRERKRHKFDMIFSTSPPFSTHLVGLIAKLILKKPWVVDFRDLWVLHPHTRPATKFHLRISKYIEHKVLKFADKIITVSEPFREDLKKTYPDVSPEKFEVIPNGYDSDDFEAKNDGNEDEKFSIGHIGSLRMYSGRTPYYFLTALADLKKEVPELVEEASIFLVGAIDRPSRRIIDEIVLKFNLENTVHYTDFVSRKQAMSYMKSFDVLLFLPIESYKGCGSSRGTIAGKLYEYLATGKPILALTEEGPVRDLIKKSGCGILADYDDTQQIKREILNCYNKFKKGQLRIEPNWDFITQFERKKLTQQLANVLDELSK